MSDANDMAGRDASIHAAMMPDFVPTLSSSVNVRGPWCERYRAVAFIVALFIATRMVFALIGIHYIADIGALMQAADPELLRTDMLRTIYHLHIQPPLFNLFLGILLKAFPHDWQIVARVVWMGLGLCMVLSTHALMLRLGVGRSLALGVAVLLAVCPATILYENWLFYDYPVAAMLPMAALFLHDYVRRGRRGHLSGFLWSMAAITLTRSLFHIAWMVIALLLLLLLLPDRRREIVGATILPLLVALLPYIKNLVRFDELSSSSWLGPSLARVSTWQLDSAERKREVERGELSPVSLIRPYSSLAAYATRSGPTGIPVLDAGRKEGGYENFNNVAYLGISRAYRRDALRVILHHPGVYMSAVSRSWFYYCYPASVNFLTASNRAPIAGYERLFDLVCYGQLFDYQSAGEREGRDEYGIPKLFKIGLFIVAAILAGMINGAGHTRRMLGAGGDRAAGITLAVVLLTILWVMLVGNLLEIGENYRFRFMIDPFHHLLLALFLERWLPRRRALALLGRRMRREPGGDSGACP